MSYCTQGPHHSIRRRKKKSLTDIAAGTQHVPDGHWWFIDASSQAGRLAYSIRGRDGQNLVPFAKLDDGRGDFACFDGNDPTGDPAVLSGICAFVQES